MKKYIVKSGNVYLWKHGNIFTPYRREARIFGSYEQAKLYIKENSHRFVAGTQFGIRRVA